MHYLLLLALLSSTTDLKNGGSSSSLSRLAEQSLRRQLGSVRSVNVQVTPGQSRSGGDLDAFNVSLDGFSIDRLANLDGSPRDDSSTSPSRDDAYPTYPPSDGSDASGTSPNRNSGYGLPRYDPNDSMRRSRLNAGKLNPDDIGDILNGAGIGRGGKGGIGDILGDVLGGARSGGRIGRLRLRATNFTFQGARYDSLSADLGEIRFDWKKALRGQMEVQSIAPGSLALNLRGDQVARLLAPRLPSLSNVKVRFADGRAFVGARSGMYGVRLPFEVGARLSVQQNRVMASDFAASVARLRLPSLVVDELTRGLNPLYDFDPHNRWPLAINLSTAQAGNGVLSMRGGIQWLGLGSNRRNRDGQTQGGYGTQSRYPNDNGNTQDSYPDDRNAGDSRKREPGDVLGDIFGRSGR